MHATFRDRDLVIMSALRLGRLAMRAALGGSATAAGLSVASADTAPAPPPAASDLHMGALFRLDGRVALVTGASRG